MNKLGTFSELRCRRPRPDAGSCTPQKQGRHAAEPHAQDPLSNTFNDFTCVSNTLPSFTHVAFRSIHQAAGSFSAMAELYELLAPYFDVPDQPSSSLPPPSADDLHTRSYLTRLSTLSLSDLASTEPASLLQSAQSHLRNLQALSKRSHKAVIASSSHLRSLTSLLPSLGSEASSLDQHVPHLETAASEFAQKYDRSTENAVLDRRKRAMLLSRNADRVSDVLDLPSLLSSSVSAAQVGGATSASSTATSYASALDLHAHVKRLSALYPQSELVSTISKQAEAEIQNLTSILITSLRSPSLKLAAAMRTIGWLRRVAPDLAGDRHGSRAMATSTKSFDLSSNASHDDGALGSLFLVCRLRTLNTTLVALEPLRDLADQETTRHRHGANGVKSKLQPTSTTGSQSERYLKRYIEIFREQSFSIISMYKSIFPSGLPTAEAGHFDTTIPRNDDTILMIPPPVSSFALHLVDMLTTTLRAYMPNVSDKSVRESLLTQVLYCAGSLGRLGADFGMVVALLEADVAAADIEAVSEHTAEAPNEEEDGREWVQVMNKHRVQASRLEVLARGVGTGRKGSSSVEVQSPT